VQIFLVLLCAVLAFMAGVIAGHTTESRGRELRAGRRRIVWAGALVLPTIAFALLGWLWLARAAPLPAAPLLALLAQWERVAYHLIAPGYAVGFLLGAIPSRDAGQAPPSPTEQREPS